MGELQPLIDYVDDTDIFSIVLVNKELLRIFKDRRDKLVEELKKMTKKEVIHWNLDNSPGISYSIEKGVVKVSINVRFSNVPGYVDRLSIYPASMPRLVNHEYTTIIKGKLIANYNLNGHECSAEFFRNIELYMIISEKDTRLIFKWIPLDIGLGYSCSIDHQFEYTSIFHAR